MAHGDAAHLYSGWQPPKPLRRRHEEAERVRDLLGVVRAVWATARAAGAGPEAIERVLVAGRVVQAAYLSVRAAEPGSRAAAEACDRAAAAVLPLERAMLLMPALPMVIAAASRIAGAPPLDSVSADGERAAKKRPVR